MPGCGRERPVLAPASHAGKNKARVTLRADIGSEAEPLGHARPEPLNQHVGLIHQFEQQFDRGRVFQVEADRAAATAEWVVRLARLRSASLRPIDTQHICTKISQDHAAERGRSQAGDFDNAYAGEWTHDASALARGQATVVVAGP